MPKQVRSFLANLAKDIIVQRNGEPTNQNNFMDILLAMRKATQLSGTRMAEDDPKRVLEMTDDIFTSQMFIFYIAGFQTSATTMSFMLHYLARYNDIQDKVVAEIQTVLQNHRGKLTYEAISNLKYLDQVMNETLRLHPIADSVRRCAATAYKVPGTDFTVEKGQTFIIPLNVVHMDPVNYPDPEKYDPERFAPENVRTRHPCAFLPFGDGPRKCIGMRFARLQTKIGILKLLQRFRVEASRHTRTQFHYESARLAIYPSGGFPMKLVHRC